MDYAPDEFDLGDLEQWSEMAAEEEAVRQDRPNKKRRKPLRKNRKPSRPLNYIGQRNNNHLLRMFEQPKIDSPASSPSNIGSPSDVGEAT